MTELLSLLMTCNTFSIRYSGVIDICEASISIFHLNFIRENDLLDIVIISNKLCYWI